jgi:hypothetical protein
MLVLYEPDPLPLPLVPREPEPVLEPALAGIPRELFAILSPGAIVLFVFRERWVKPIPESILPPA